MIKLDFDLANISVKGQLYENMFLYDISDKNLIGPKLSRIRHDKIDGFIKIYSGSKYLVLLVPEK